MTSLTAFALSMSSAPPASAWTGTCSRCGRPMNVNRKSLPPAERMCQSCRRELSGRDKRLLTAEERSQRAKDAARARWDDKPRTPPSPCRTGNHAQCELDEHHGACSECGKTVRVNPWTSAPPERRRCRDCQRANPRPRGRGSRKPLPPRVCELCEEPYVPKSGPRPGTQQRCCSKSCARAWLNGARPPYERQVVTGMPRKVALVRARYLRHAQTWDGITDEEILERDGWRCQIPGCKRRPIRRDAAYPHPRSKSIDHVIPLSLGGDDTSVNKRAAHLRCNVTRGNRMTAEQLPLFGSIREPPLATMTAGERAPTTQRKRRPCGCGADTVKGRKFCRDCLDQRAAEREARSAEKAELFPSSPVHYYACRYCGDLKACRRKGQPREVCPARACQLARLMANNLRARNGLTADEADARMIALVAATMGRSKVAA